MRNLERSSIISAIKNTAAKMLPKILQRIEGGEVRGRSRTISQCSPLTTSVYETQQPFNFRALQIKKTKNKKVGGGTTPAAKINGGLLSIA